MSFLVVKCSDGVVVQVDREIILKFSVGFQKKVAESESETAPITLDNVNSRSLAKVIEYCSVHNDPDISPADLKVWDNKFVKVEPSVLCELASAAYHLEIKPMVDLTCYAIAQLLKGNTPEEIRRIFNIIYDFGPDDDVPPPTIRDKLRNRWIRKTNGKRGSNASLADIPPNPLIQTLLPAPPPAETPSTELVTLSPASDSLVHSPNLSLSNLQLQQSDEDTRSVDELLSFINSDGSKQKTSKTSSKSKKAKRRDKKKKKDEPNNTTTTTTTTTAHSTTSNTNNNDTEQPSKDNDKKQRSRKNNATSNPSQNNQLKDNGSDTSKEENVQDDNSDTKENESCTSESADEHEEAPHEEEVPQEEDDELNNYDYEDEVDEDDDGDVDREVEEFRRRLESAKRTTTGQRMPLPSALSIALSVLGPKK